MSPVDSGSDASSSGPWLEWASWLATVSTIGLFSSGIWTCRKIHASKSVGSVPHLPFVAASVNCSLWMTYGLLKPDSTVTYVNVIGLILQLGYILVYHTYVEMKFRVQRDFLIALAIVLCISVYYSFFVADHMKTIRQMGVVCNFFTIIFFASPLSTMAEVVRTKATDSMSLPLSIMSTCTTCSWILYGGLVRDVYIIFPNAAGLVLACIQLSLFIIYNKSKSTAVVSMETPIV